MCVCVCVCVEREREREKEPVESAILSFKNIVLMSFL
jgi:hypothetical protein